MVILLGAGASAEAGIPTANAMTREMLRLFGEERRGRTAYNVLCYVVGALQSQRGRRGENPLDPVNIESVFNAIDMLSRRYEHEMAPFVGAWQDRINELDVISKRFERPHGKRYVGRKNDRQSEEVMQATAAHAAYDMLAKAGMDKVTAPGHGKVFSEVASEMISSLFKMTTIDGEKNTMAVGKLVCKCKELSLPIFTLNYDNVIETACVQNEIKYIYPHLEVSEIGREKDGDTIMYYKLHGSVNWKEDYGSLYSGRIIAEPFTKVPMKPVLIFGGNKMTTRRPFFQMFVDLRNQLHSSERVLTIGYSYSDPHLNDLFEEWLLQSNTRKIMVSTKGMCSAAMEMASKYNAVDRVERCENGISEDIEQILEFIQ